MAPFRSPNGQRWKKLILAAFSTFLALGIVEIALRVVHHFRYQAALANHLATDGKSTVVFSDVPDLVYACRPNIAGTNSRGYFDVEHSFRKPVDVFRIVLIGDSVVVGHHVGWRASFGKQLQEELNRQALQRKVEVILLACTGYSTSQELVLLRNEAFPVPAGLDSLVLRAQRPGPSAVPRAPAATWPCCTSPSATWPTCWPAPGFNLREWYLGLGGPTEFHKRLALCLLGPGRRVPRPDWPGVPRASRPLSLHDPSPVRTGRDPGRILVSRPAYESQGGGRQAGLESVDLREAYGAFAGRDWHRKRSLASQRPRTPVLGRVSLPLPDRDHWVRLQNCMHNK